jgi:hypothetical protein
MGVGIPSEMRENVSHRPTLQAARRTHTRLVETGDGVEHRPM